MTDHGPIRLSWKERSLLAKAKEEAKRFLADTVGWSVVDQLKSRGIRKIIRFPIKKSDGWLVPHGRRFDIFVHDENCISEQAITVGHELGHTFHFLLQRGRQRDFLRHFRSSGPNAPFVYERVESFCRRFAEKWLAVGNNRAEIEDILANFPEDEFTLTSH